MLTRNKNDIKTDKLKRLKKRRYSQIIDANTHEPINKHRKLKETKQENDENNSENILLDEITDSDTSEFKDFIKHFAIPSNIYKYLAVRHKLNPFIMKRCVPYNKQAHSEFSRSNIQSISDHLATVRLYDENIALMKGKLTHSNNIKTSMKITIKFDQFLDSKLQKDWETVEAFVYVDIVHLYRDNRKNKDGFCTNRVITNQRIYCNRINSDDDHSYVIDIEEAMASVSTYRVHKSLLHFKILAKEKKLYFKNISQDKKSEGLYPVTYEAMMPFFSNRDDLHMHREAYFIQSGKYEIFPRVTNMEKCDDSIFSGSMPNVYNSEEDQYDDLDCHWVKIDDLQSANVNKNNTKIVFTISTDESPKLTQKPLKTHNKSLLPVVQLSPMQNGDHCLSSVRIQSKQKIDVNLAFKFLVEGNVVQWTQTKHLTCPWCQMNFSCTSDLFTTLTKLVQHLNFMHPRFTYTCKKLSNRTLFAKSLSKKFVTIDVTLTEVSTTDWDLGLILKDKMPARRMSLSEVIYNKYQRPIPSLYRPNHERDYCHTWSSRKNKYIEFDIDSEAEENMRWMFDHYSRKVEEFSDLNHIEKRVIQIWNDSLLRYGFNVGDLQMKNFVEHFVAGLCDNKEKLREVKTLRNTLVLHLVNLIDYGVLPPAVMARAMRSLDQALAQLP